jgi:hypothetical protein
VRIRTLQALVWNDALRYRQVLLRLDPKGNDDRRGGSQGFGVDEGILVN